MNNKLQAKDLINLGLFTVLYFVLGCCVAIPIGFVPIFLPILGALWTLITGIPFMLFLTRVKKFGMVTLMAILSGLLMGLTGMGYWGVPLGLIFGLLGDLILKFGNYKSVKRSLIGYAVFSLWMVGTYIPMYFMVEDSRASFAASFGKEYADKVMAVMPMWSIVLVIAGKYAVLYAVCFVLERLALNVWSGMISFLILAATSIMTRFAPGIMTGAYLISSTSVSEFISAMERMHVTEKIIIPLSVIFRFFPTIKEEYQAIRDAMKMRNIRFGGKNPFLMIEYRLIPLMVSVIKIGDELSAAALTRGLGAPVRRTNVCEIGFHVQDFIAIVVCFACFILFFLHQYIVF